MGICLDKDDNDRLPNSESQLNQEDKNICDKAEQIDLQDEPEKTTQTKVGLNEFEFLKVVGRGSFGKVMLVSFKSNQKLYAMKVLRKEAVQRKKQKRHTQDERSILETVHHPFIVQLHFAFQTQSKLYLITDFMIGGELFTHLRKAFKFNEDRAKFYAAELVLAIEYLHGKGIIYRDLKPENILIGEDGHLKITDFGLSKVDLADGEKTNTFCGTPEYLAPEIIVGRGHDKTADWWSLGALIYEMLSGAPPFYNKDKNLMYKNRLEKPIEMRQWFSKNSISILQGLLCNDPKYRLGHNGSEEIKNHPFFEEIDWVAYFKKQVDPPFKPKIQHSRDLRNFDPMFTDENPVDTPVNWSVGKDDQYDKFTYGGNDFNDKYESKRNNNSNMDINPNFKLNSTKQEIIQKQ